MLLTRHVATVGSGTLFSRVLAFARDAGIAAWLGAGPFSEAFFAMLQVVNFFRRLLADGALNAAFVPIWLKLRDGDDGAANADRFTRRSLLTMLCVTGIVALLTIITAPYLVHVVAPGFDETRRLLTAVLLTLAVPYIVLAGLVAVVAGALNAEGYVGAVTVSTALFNVVMVAAVTFCITANIIEFDFALVLTTAIVAAGFLQLLVTLLAWFATGKRWRRASVRTSDQTRTLFARAVPGLVAAGIPQLKLIAATAIVSSSPAAVAWLYYANRLYELPLGVASVAIASVIVPHIVAGLRAGDTAAAQSRAFEIAFGLALPAATGFAVLAQPIAGALFERGAFGPADTAAVAAALMAICGGLPGHVLEKVFGAVSFAHEDTRTPMLTALCALASAIFGGLLAFPYFGFVGVAAAVAVSAWVGAGILGVVLYRRGWLHLDGDAARRLPRIVLATAIMGVATGYAFSVSRDLTVAPPASGRLILLIASIAAGIGIYLGALQLLGVARLKDLAGSLRRAR
jgi:putative peptidoglycan lipid II flippase